MGCCMTTPNAQNGQPITVNHEISRPLPNPRDNSGQQRSRRSEGGSQGQSSQRRNGGQQPSGGAGQRSQNTTGLRITYLQNPQVEIIKNDKTVGQGVQKTLAFDTPFTVEELEKWRTDFWETRTSGSKQVWQLLKNACEAEHEDAFALILAAQLQLPQESLTTAIDQAGVYYRVPICCIQSPDAYQVDSAMDAIKAKKAPKEKQLSIKVRNPGLGDQTVILSNLSTVEMVKTAYLSQVGETKVAEKDATVARMRFFCLGKELKNDLFLYSYEMNDNIVVQAMLRAA